MFSCKLLNFKINYKNAVAICVLAYNLGILLKLEMSGW